jgi:hypothetical protein
MYNHGNAVKELIVPTCNGSYIIPNCVFFFIFLCTHLESICYCQYRFKFAVFVNSSFEVKYFKY